MSASTANRPVRLTLYGRTYCHLCEDMLVELKALSGELAIEIDLVDIDRDPELEVRFGEWVPVLAHGETRICHYPLDLGKLTAHLSAFR